MRFDITTLQRLYDTLVKAHLPPSACVHPKSALVICDGCERVYCSTCQGTRVCCAREQVNVLAAPVWPDPGSSDPATTKGWPRT